MKNGIKFQGENATRILQNTLKHQQRSKRHGNKPFSSFKLSSNKSVSIMKSEKSI